MEWGQMSRTYTVVLIKENKKKPKSKRKKEREVRQQLGGSLNREASADLEDVLKGCGRVKSTT